MVLAGHAVVACAVLFNLTFADRVAEQAQHFVLSQEKSG